MDIRKIYIVGGPGSGKSTLAKGITKTIGFCHYDLDDLFWDNAAEAFNIRAEPIIRDKKLGEIILKQCWIIEGIFYKWPSVAFEKSDEIVILKVNAFIRDLRIIKRFIFRKLGNEIYNKNETLKDLWYSIKWNHIYEKRYLIDIRKATAAHHSKRVILTTKSEIRQYKKKFQTAAVL